MSLILAILLDALLGEPRWLWSRLLHPAVIIGNIISKLSNLMNHAPQQRTKGVLLVLTLAIGGGITGLFITWLGPIADVVTVAILLAHKSLVEHVSDVAQSLRMSLFSGQRSVAMIVGRDTTEMNTEQVSRAAIESMAENFSDGFVAPVFWFLVAGLPGIIIYKAINTSDSMIGYKNRTFKDFGWATARVDDVLNWIPARLSALCIWAITGFPVKWRFIAQNARLHRSPNAGWPEAAMAYALEIRLSGPRSYEGQMQKFPWVNPIGRKNIGPSEIDNAIRILWATWVGVLALVTASAILFFFL
jgi:adenosylcobinamide-phosphate synthase